MRQGFTLVELAIVLVIIGLIAGGILVGQSMITTVRIQAFVRQVQSYDIAFSNFATRYKVLPGDNTILMAGIGNNDGIIGNNSGVSVPDPHAWAGEMSNVWPQLSQIGLQSSEEGANYSSTFAAGMAGNLPLSRLGNKARFLVFGDANPAIFNSTSPVNFYFIASFAKSTSSLPLISNRAIKGVDAKAVDVKLDDGSGLTGNMVNKNTDNVTLEFYLELADAAAAEYDLSTSNPTSAPVIKLNAAAN